MSGDHAEHNQPMTGPSSSDPTPAPRTGGGNAGRWQPPAPEELRSLIHDCEITRLIGRGGMGAVYEGRQITLDRRVAVKILPADLADDDLGFAERFKNEARAMARLSHPGIVTVHDCGETATGLLYIVMEFIEGTDVAHMIVEQGRLHSEHAMAITAHVCDALAYAHERGIIHRDIKPANIMVGYDGVVKVADFGLAKVSHSGQTTGLTQSGQVMGTLHYMAPEALTLGTAVDQRADIYAVGVMLYQMLTGKLPQGLFEMPSLQVPGLDPRYDGIIARALREDRNLRYPSARDLRGDLDGILTQPVIKVEAAAEKAPAALPTQARPQRPAGQPPRAPQQRATPRPQQRTSPLPWIVVLAVAGFAAWYLLGGSRTETTATTGTKSGSIASSSGGGTMPGSTTKDPPFVNTLGMKFVRLPDTNVYLCIHETRKKDYAAYAAANSGVDRSWEAVSYNGVPVSDGDDHPVVRVSWDDSQSFCSWLSKKEGRNYRLPSDREWTIAAGIGDREQPGSSPDLLHLGIPNVYPWGNVWPPPGGSGNFSDMSYRAKNPQSSIIGDYDDSRATTSEVMLYKPNVLGIYDLGGNVWEWCTDWWDAAKEQRVLRGGAWDTNQREQLLSSYRLHSKPGIRHPGGCGFRCALVAPASGVIDDLMRKRSPDPGTAGPSAGATAIPPDDLQRGLIGWWKADGDARDSAGSNHGKLVDKAGYADGRFGQSFLIDGGYVEIADSPSLRFGPESPFTAALWACRTSPSPTFHLFGKRAPTNTPLIDGYQLGVDPKVPETPLNEWVFWVLENDGKNQTIYINGEKAAETHQMQRVSAAPLRIGRSAQWGGFEGQIDDLRFYSRALTQTEIRSLFESGKSFSKQAASEPRPIPELAALQQQLAALTAERVTGVFDADVSKLNASYLGGIDREIAKERAAGRLDGVLALEEEKKLVAGKQPVPAADDDKTNTALKNLRAIYRDSFAKLEATRATNLKALTDPLSVRLKTLESDLTKASRITDAKAVRDFRETLPVSESAVAFSASNPFVNSLGMKFVPVPGTDVLMCIHITRRADYAAYAAAVPGVDSSWQTHPKDDKSSPVNLDDDYPVVGVSWDDATAFCEWLSKKDGQTYRLPTDEEWSHAAGIGPQEKDRKNTAPEVLSGRIKDVFPWGTQWPPPKGAGNFDDTSHAAMFPKDSSPIPGYTDGFPLTSPVFAFKPNKLGIHDLSGNITQWCADWYDKAQTQRVRRGIDYQSGSKRSGYFTSQRWGSKPDGRLYMDIGFASFRPVVVAASIKSAGTSNPKPASTLTPTPSATSGSPGSAFKNSLGMTLADASFTNSLGMKFVPVPGTKVLMCIHEARRKDYAAYAAGTPGVDGGWKTVSDGGVPVSESDDHPVVMISWDDATAFCKWLSGKEGRTYRLPTDHEWSRAAGIGTKERANGATPASLTGKIRDEYPWGNQWPPPKGAGNYADTATKAAMPSRDSIPRYTDGYPTTSPVMSLKPNKLGIYDMGGNAWEWCEDWFDSSRLERVLRGGGWDYHKPDDLLSSNRGHHLAETRTNDHGFRCVIELPKP